MRAACSAVGSHKVVKSGEGRASTLNYCRKLGCFFKSQLAFIPPYCTGGALSIFLKEQIIASDREEGLHIAYLLKIFLRMTLSIVSALFVYNHGGDFSSTHSFSLYRGSQADSC